MAENTHGVRACARCGGRADVAWCCETDGCPEKAAPGVTVPAPAYEQVGWTIDTGNGRIFDTGASLNDEQRTRWVPVYVAAGVKTCDEPQGENRG